MNEVLQEQKRKSYEERKAEKARGKAVRERKKRLKRAGKKIALGIVAVFAAVGLFFWVRSARPQGPDYSRAYEILGREHVAVGSEHPPYNSNPPSSGWHYGETAENKFYYEPIADEYVVHNLEHGDIWIAYHPRVSEGLQEQLKKFLGPKIVITPREENEFDVALVAWGRVDAFNVENDTLPETRIRDFIKRYINKGPEKISPFARRSF